MDSRLNQLNKALKDELYKHKAKKTKKAFLFFIIFLIIGVFSFAFFSIDGSTIAKNTTAKTAAKPIIKLKAAIADIFPSFSLEQETNFLLLGAPGKGNDAPDLTDTIVLAKINPDPLKTEPRTMPQSGSGARVTLISIPRDLWVKVPEAEYFSKINSLYANGKAARNNEYGLKLIKQKVEQITGEKINYYALVDLSVIKKIIDELGGINVLIEKDIKDEQFPGPNHSFQIFEIKAGWRYLDGETASKYMRTRHSIGGDFDRIKRQQQILEATKQKLMNVDPIFELPELLKIAANIWGNIQTNISLTQLPAFWQTAKKISPDNINNIILDADLENGVLTSGRSIPGFAGMSVLVPKAGVENYDEIQKFIAENR